MTTTEYRVPLHIIRRRQICGEICIFSDINKGCPWIINLYPHYQCFNNQVDNVTCCLKFPQSRGVDVIHIKQLYKPCVQCKQGSYTKEQERNTAKCEHSSSSSLVRFLELKIQWPSAETVKHECNAICDSGDSSAANKVQGSQELCDLSTHFGCWTKERLRCSHYIRTVGFPLFSLCSTSVSRKCSEFQVDSADIRASVNNDIWWNSKRPLWGSLITGNLWLAKIRTLTSDRREFGQRL